MFSFIMDGFAHAAEALSGKYLGMNNKGLLKKTVKYVFLWGTALSAIFSLVYFTLGEFVLIIFTDNVDIIHGAKPFLIWVAIVPLLSFASYLWDGIYIGVTASRAMRDTMLFSALLVFTPLYYSLNQYFENHALWMALLVFLLARGVKQNFWGFEFLCINS
jgi:MATE family multidrug resistance protein